MLDQTTIYHNKNETTKKEGISNKFLEFPLISRDVKTQNSIT